MARPQRAPYRPLLVIVALAVALSGCASAIDEGARRLSGEEDWRPASPEDETYRIAIGDGHEAPHPFRFEGPFASLYLYGLPATATTGGLSALQVVRQLRDMDAQGADPAAAATDPTVRGDLEAERDILFIGGAQGRLVHAGGETPLAGERLYITAREGHLRLKGTMDLEIHTAFAVDREGVRMSFAGYPFPLDGTAAGTPDLRATPREDVVVESVRVRWGTGAEGYAHDVNGTLILDGGHAVRLGAPAFSFVPTGLVVASPDTPGSALGGHRTRAPVGWMHLRAEAGVLHLREVPMAFDASSVEVRELGRFVFDPTTTTLEVAGMADQILEGTRPWIESEIEITHPAQEDARTVTLRVPPGETFRTMLGVRESSDVGSAVDVQPRVGTNDRNIIVTLGDRWEDERVLDDTLSRALLDAFSSFFWIPDGEVRLGPQAVAYLPVSFEVPSDLAEPTEVELVLHPRNAAVLHVDFVLVPDADAGTSDVGSRTPVPTWVGLLAVLGAALALARLRR